MQTTTSSSALTSVVTDVPTDIAVQPDPALVARIKVRNPAFSVQPAFATFSGEAATRVASFADTILRDTASQSRGSARSAT